tara:strand:- start:250 stop:531 length:282 start_codon:yes stop_codon:yes gene_type:complete
MNLEIRATIGTYNVLKKATFDTKDTCRAYCCKPIPQNKKKPVIKHKYVYLLDEKIILKFFFSNNIAKGKTVKSAKKNLAKLKVNGPIDSIPVF